MLQESTSHVLAEKVGLIISKRKYRRIASWLYRSNANFDDNCYISPQSVIVIIALRFNTAKYLV